MKLFRTKILTEQNTVVAIGNFDGMHIGHQRILQSLLSCAHKNNARPLVVTFEPYPQEYFNRDNNFRRLSSLREKINYMRNVNTLNDLKDIYILKFNDHLSSYSPENFIQQVLKEKLNALHVVVGEDFKFGYQRQGDITILKKYLPTEIIPSIIYENKRVSSTWAREVLKNNDFNMAKRLLGHEYSLIGRVVRGNQRGRQLGFPTANISFQSRLPVFTGVYAVTVNQKWKAVANLGIRPTFYQDSKIFLEVHVLDFNNDLYGKYLEITFIEKIRDEMRFGSIVDLKMQIQRDIIQARELMK